jgi:hypothetical protein
LEGSAAVLSLSCGPAHKLTDFDGDVAVHRHLNIADLLRADVDDTALEDRAGPIRDSTRRECPAASTLKHNWFL